MSATIKRYDVTIEWGHGYAEEKPAGNWVDYDDHLASHAYDEAKERAAFEAQRQPSHCIKFADGSYQYVDVDLKWQGWQLCAKARAKDAGCE